MADTNSVESSEWTVVTKKARRPLVINNIREHFLKDTKKCIKLGKCFNSVCLNNNRSDDQNNKADEQNIKKEYICPHILKCNDKKCIDSHNGQLKSAEQNIKEALENLKRGNKIIYKKPKKTIVNDKIKIEFEEQELDKELLYHLLLNNKITCHFKEKCKNLNSEDSKCNYVHTCKCTEKKCKLLHFNKY